VGLFDETMGRTEDRDLWFRIAERFPVGYIAEILAYYRISPTSLSSDYGRMLTWQLFFIEKHHKTGACGKAVMRQALGNLYRELGDVHLSNGELKRSLRHYFTAVQYDPLNVPNIYMLFRAMGEPLLARMRVVANAVIAC